MGIFDSRPVQISLFLFIFYLALALFANIQQKPNLDEVMYYYNKLVNLQTQEQQQQQQHVREEQQGGGWNPLGALINALWGIINFIISLFQKVIDFILFLFSLAKFLFDTLLTKPFVYLQVLIANAVTPIFGSSIAHVFGLLFSGILFVLMILGIVDVLIKIIHGG